MKPEKTYYKNGQVKNEIWRNEAGATHRLDGPAFRWWYDDGRLEREAWFINGKNHRLDGPAYLIWINDGQLEYEGWFINGVNYNTESEFLVAVDLYKANEMVELF